MAYGTLTTFDALVNVSQSVEAYGEQRLFEATAAMLAAHNRFEADMRGSLLLPTTDRQRLYGADVTLTMDEIDEMARPDAQKTSLGSMVGFPMRLYGGSLQWTRKYFQNTPVSELANNITGMMIADTRRRNREIKRAIFGGVNSTFFDRLMTPQINLAVKALVNADGEAIPPGPNGESFNGASHTHYLARAGGSVAASDVTDLLNTVAEHYNVGELRLYINAAQEATIRGFTSNFKEYVDPRLTIPSTATVGTRPLDVRNLGDRAIGIFNQAVVWVKPWIPANYMFAYIEGAPEPLAYRTRNPGGGGLELVADDEVHPLRARSWEAEYGISVWNRTNGAALYIGDTTYAAPTIND